MLLQKVLYKSLAEMQKFCEAHKCEHCKMHQLSMATGGTCKLGYPRSWSINESDLKQVGVANFDLDHYELYDFFDEEEE